MNKKLLSLAVAAAVAAPTAAMAEAVLYGKLHQSIDYVSVNNIVGNEYVEVDALPINEYFPTDSTETVTRYIPLDGTEELPVYNATGENVPYDFVDPTGNRYVGELTPGQVLTGSYTIDETTPAGIVVFGDDAIPVVLTDENGTPLINRAGTEDFDGWGVSGNSWRRYVLVNPGTGIGGPANSRANRIGVKGSEDLGSGLKAIYQVELGINLSSNDNNIPGGDNGISFRNSFAGIASNYGTLLVGRHDTPLKISTGKLDLFSDTMADYNSTVGFHDVRADNVIAYISPTYAGVSFMGAAVAGGGASAGEGLNYENTSLASAYSLALIYNNGPFYAGAAYEVLSNEMFMDSETSKAGQQGCLNDAGVALNSCDYVDDDFSKWRIGLGLLDWNGFTLTAVYEDQSDLPGGQRLEEIGFYNPNTGTVNFNGVAGISDQKLWQVQAGYSFGNTMFKAMYGSVTRDAGKAFSNTRGETIAINNISNLASGVRKDLEGDRNTWAVGLDHNFSKRTKVYALYTDVDDDFDGVPGYNGVDWGGFSLGLIHAF